MDVYESTLDDVARVVELTPSRDSDEILYSIHVPEGAAALVLGVGDIVDGRGFRLPRGVRVRLTRPNGEPVATGDPDLDSELSTFSEPGLVSFVANEPQPGEWKLLVSHSEAESFSVIAAVFRRPLQALLGFVSRHRCKACKVSVRAALYAVLAKLTAGTVAVFNLEEFAHTIIQLPTALLDFLANVLGVDPGSLGDFLQSAAAFFEFESPLERLVRQICEFIGLCRPGESAV